MTDRKELKFEEGLQKLENIVKALEGDGLSLEEALDYYQEGIELVQVCRRRLQEVEGKLQVLVSQEGQPVIKELPVTGDENNDV